MPRFDELGACGVAVLFDAHSVPLDDLLLASVCGSDLVRRYADAELRTERRLRERIERKHPELLVPGASEVDWRPDTTIPEDFYSL